MDELQRSREVRLQRRATVAAIEAVEAWARVHRKLGSTTYTEMIDRYLYSLNVDTVAELDEIEAQAHAHLQRLQGR